jgi:Ca-activated chloride channel family protein
MPEWLSLRWFLPSVLTNFHWDEKWYLYAIAGIPLLFVIRWLFYNRNNQRLGLSLTNTYLKTDWISYLRYVVPIMFSLGIGCVLMSLARPQKVSESTENYAEGIDIMLALDISDSMLEQDLQPNRLEAAKEVAREFIEGRLSDRIGLVVFSGEARSISPLTTDYESLNEQINGIQNNLIATAGTAIGSALATCINRLRDVSGSSKVAILLSDGSNTSGQLDPLTAADLAKFFNIRIYTVAIGKDIKGGELDESSLREIAKEGNGKFFRATDNATLENIFEQINKIEKIEIKNNVQRDVQDYYYIYLNWAVVFFLIAFTLKNTFLGNITED